MDSTTPTKSTPNSYKSPISNNQSPSFTKYHSPTRYPSTFPTLPNSSSNLSHRLTSPIKRTPNKNLSSPLRTPPRTIEYQDRFIPARTPRSARIRLDFSDTDQGPLTVSPFKHFRKSDAPNSISNRQIDASTAPSSTLAATSLFVNNRQSSTSSISEGTTRSSRQTPSLPEEPIFVASRLFRNNRVENSNNINIPNNNNNNLPNSARSTATNVNIDHFNQGQHNREQLTYQTMIANELLNAGIENLPETMDGTGDQKIGNFNAATGVSPMLSHFNLKTQADNTNNKLRAFHSPAARRSLFEYNNISEPPSKLNFEGSNPFTKSPLSNASQKLLSSPRKPQRKIPKMPYKVLDAPELADDFYLNLVDWGMNNCLAVGLGNCVYLWNAANSNVTKLCDYSNENDSITSVCWCESGISPIVGVTRQKFFRELEENPDKKDAVIDEIDINRPRLNSSVLFKPGNFQNRTISSVSSVTQNLINGGEIFSDPEIIRQSSPISIACSSDSNISELPSSSSNVSLNPTSKFENKNCSDLTVKPIETVMEDRMQKTPSPDFNLESNLVNTISNQPRRNAAIRTNPTRFYGSKNKCYADENMSPSNDKENLAVQPEPTIDFTKTNMQDLIAIGTSRGYVQIWNTESQKIIFNIKVHDQRVGALAWNNYLITSGSRDRTIGQFDIRKGPRSIRKFTGHRQEVCGLRWSPDRCFLASGGNDNKLLIWDLKKQDKPMSIFTNHIAAVKAIAWSPHQHGILASGGGTADRCIKFWNTQTASLVSSIDTGSQVCNLAWSRHSNEVVSTHGYSQNQIIVWKYPTMMPLAKLIGHTFRVLFLAMSPDGEAVVTGAGDETLRFWNIFSKSKNSKQNDNLLMLRNCIR